ncbi:MAG TPA: CBS domain-containing protein, partial [Pedobacter sp.]
MNIRPIIITTFTFISIKKDRFEAAEQLKISPYLVVINEDMDVTGIITPGDLVKDQAIQLADMNLHKPAAHPDHNISEVFDTMKNQGLDLMPVFENNVFTGVISLEKLTERLLNKAKELQHLYHQMLHDLRNPVSNIQGLMAIL